MVTVSFEVKEYRIYLPRSGKANISGFKKTVKYRGVINCFGEHNHQDYCFQIFFLASGKVPSPRYDYENKVGVMFLLIKDMPIFVDVLRNEKPVYANLNSKYPEDNGLLVRMEPVGEGEIAPP